MQFSCESCKATLHIADEKVKGKRLVVRCKRCGSRIQISDPALGIAAVMLAQQPAKPAAPEPAPPAPAIAEVRLPTADEERDSDTESTRAMDTAVLEKALRASKSDDPAAAKRAPAAPAPSASALARSAAPEPTLWFAMIAGKQQGPFGAAELDRRVADGAIGPRTYVWKEGMGGWLRSKDVPEVATLLHIAPEPAASNPAPAFPAASHSRNPFEPAAPAPADSKAMAPLAPAPASFSAAPFAVAPFAVAPPAAGPVALARGGGVALPAALPAQTQQPAEAPATSAMELARWASSQLAERNEVAAQPSRPEEPRAAASTPAPVALPTGSADPFAEVPDAPGLRPLDAKDSTDAILVRSGVRRNRSLTVAMTIAGALALLAVLVFALSRGGDKQPAPQQPAPAPEAQRPSLGGTGDTSVAGLQAGQPGSAPEHRASTDAKGAARHSAAARPDGAHDQLTADQEAAMKSLDDSQLGIGSHGPSARDEDAPAQAKVDSPLTADDVNKKVAENKGALQGCIDEALHRDPGLRVGKIHISTTIAPSGVVTGATIDKRNVGESQLGSCLKRATRRIVFPSFAGDAFEVDIPIVVTAGD